LTIAQRFIAGLVRQRNPSRPVGTTEASRLLKRKRLHARMHSTVPTGRRNVIFNRFPALKCWAIFNCPFGPRFRSLQHLKMPANHHETQRDLITPNRQSLVNFHQQNQRFSGAYSFDPRIDLSVRQKTRLSLSIAGLWVDKRTERRQNSWATVKTAASRIFALKGRNRRRNSLIGQGINWLS
jgi:hypothetical protein